MKNISSFKIFLEKNEEIVWHLPLSVKMKRNSGRRTGGFRNGMNMSSKTPDFTFDFYGFEGCTANAFDGWEDLGEFTNKKDFLDTISKLVSDSWDYRQIVSRITNMEERFIHGNPNKKWRYQYELSSGRFDSNGNLKKRWM